MTPPQILFCNCTYAQVVPKEVKEAVLRKLCESGVSPLKVNKAIREIHGMGISLSSLPASRVVIFEKSVYKWDDKRKDPFWMSDGQQAFGFILDLSSIRDELVAGIERLAAQGFSTWKLQSSASKNSKTFP